MARELLHGRQKRLPPAPQLLQKATGMKAKAMVAPYISANWAAAAAAASPLALLPPDGLDASLGLLGPVEAARAKARQWLTALTRTMRWRRNRKPSGGGGRRRDPLPPDDERDTAGSIWDDPALWMLMMH
jgi:hypothetical protein